MFAAIVNDRDESILGYAWSWTIRRECCRSFISFAVDPELPLCDAIYLTRLLLAWTRHSLLQAQDYRGNLVIVHLGSDLYRYRYLLEKIAPCILENIYPSSFLMELSSSRVPAAPRVECSIREAKPHKDKRDASAISEIFNDAFSIYEDYSSWDVESITRYYSSLFTRRKAIVLIAETKEGHPVGVIESYIYKSLTGRSIGYHSMLAVRKKFQKKGVGKTLLLMATKWLLENGAERIILDSEPKSYGFYVKLGFKLLRVSYRSKTSVNCLPEDPVAGITVWDK